MEGGYGVFLRTSLRDDLVFCIDFIELDYYGFDINGVLAIGAKPGTILPFSVWFDEGTILIKVTKPPIEIT